MLLNTERPTSLNSTAAANTAVVQTFAAVVGESHRLAFVAVSFTGGTGTGTLTVADGGTTIYQIDLVLVIGTPFQITFPLGGLGGTINTAMTVTLAAGGTLAVGKLSTARYTI